MKRSIRYGWLVVILSVVLFAGGCAAYYRVTDPQSGKSYYTQKIDDVQGGAVKMKDARTGSVITLQSSEVKEISEKEFKAGLAAPVSSPASAPAAVVAPEAAPSAAPAPTPGPAEVSAPAAAPTAEPASTPPAEPGAEPAPAAEPSSAPGGTK